MARAMTPGMMMRTRANILMKVKVTCVREARLTLQQLMATTNAAGGGGGGGDKGSKRRTPRAEEAEQHSLSPRMLTSLMSTTGAGHGAKNGSTT